MGTSKHDTRRKAFYKKINNHINNANKNMIIDMVHMPESNKNNIPIKRWFEAILKHKFEYYKFTRLDETHPDNQKYVNDNYNLDISWIIEFHKKIGDTNYTYVYEVGEYNGKLAFALPEN